MAPVNELLVAFSQFSIEPVFPDKVKSLGIAPEQMVWSVLTVPGTVTGST